MLSVITIQLVELVQRHHITPIEQYVINLSLQNQILLD